MRFSLQLPTDRVAAGAEFVSGPAIASMAKAIESAGIDACFVTDHPFPSQRWLDSGGHHALDPYLALAFAAAATTRLRVQTNVSVLGYRNPFITAKCVATLDVLSGGRVILGIAAGYQRSEFAALGADFDARNDLADEAIIAMKRAWTEQGVEMTGRHFAASGNTMLPRPLQQPHPPLWVGGNSKRAIRRAVEHADGWIPFATAGIAPDRVRTARLETLDDLEARIGYARRLVDETSRARPLDICFVPPGLSVRENETLEPARFAQTVDALGRLGVTWMTLSLPAPSRAGYCEAVARFGEELLAPLR